MKWCGMLPIEQSIQKQPPSWTTLTPPHKIQIHNTSTGDLWSCSSKPMATTSKAQWDWDTWICVTSESRSSDLRCISTIWLHINAIMQKVCTALRDWLRLFLINPDPGHVFSLLYLSCLMNFLTSLKDKHQKSADWWGISVVRNVCSLN